jgi:hypothetical protein
VFLLPLATHTPLTNLSYTGSKVYLDLNENRKFDSNEPHTVTDENGNYTLDIPKEYHNGYHTLVVSDGTDTGTQKPFKGTLTAVKEANETTYNITPLTSVVEARYRYYKVVPIDFKATKKNKSHF